MEAWMREREKNHTRGGRQRERETNERENENRIKIVAERNPHFSFQPSRLDALEIRQSDLMALGGSVSLGLGENDGRMMRKVRESR